MFTTFAKNKVPATTGRAFKTTSVSKQLTFQKTKEELTRKTHFRETKCACGNGVRLTQTHVSKTNRKFQKNIIFTTTKEN